MFKSFLKDAMKWSNMRQSGRLSFLEVEFLFIHIFGVAKKDKSTLVEGEDKGVLNHRERGGSPTGSTPVDAHRYFVQRDGAWGKPCRM